MSIFKVNKIHKIRILLDARQINLKIRMEVITIENKELPRMRTIREIAKTGLLSEYGLRKLEKQGKLPCVYVGRKCLINLDRLIDQLNNPQTEGR